MWGTLELGRRERSHREKCGNQGYWVSQKANLKSNKFPTLLRKIATKTGILNNRTGPKLPPPGEGRASSKRGKERRQRPGVTKLLYIFPIPLPFCTGPSLLRVVPKQEAPQDRGGGKGAGPCN